MHRIEYLHLGCKGPGGSEESCPENKDKKNRWSIQRGCDSSCSQDTSNFCVEMGTRTKVLYCTSCCTGDLCNKDSKAAQKGPIHTLLANQLIFIFVLYKITM